MKYILVRGDVFGCFGAAQAMLQSGCIGNLLESRRKEEGDGDCSSPNYIQQYRERPICHRRRAPHLPTAPRWHDEI